MNAAEDLPPCTIFIDKEGNWFHEGQPMVRRDIIQLFYAHLTLNAAGEYVLEWRGQRCRMDVADTAFVVWGVSPEPRGEALRLHLSDQSRETLRADTLRIGPDHVPYCRVKGAAFPARFNRAAYYQLAAFIEEDADGYVLVQGECRRRIPVEQPPG